MIITQTPLRISLAGGGTDFADFYRQHGGSVISSAIDKYIYVIIKSRFDKKIRIGYTKTEMVDSVDQIEHELVRECLRFTGITSGVEISTMADIPSEGSGLGSSSTVTVGLLNALYTYKGELVTAERLAQEACQIEIDILKKPIGKQDQYIAAYGGLRVITFHQDETVEIQKVHADEDKIREVGNSILLFYTGISRKADPILAEQKANIAEMNKNLIKMRDQVPCVQEAILKADSAKLGQILNTGWNLKRQLAGGISNNEIDNCYNTALQAGAYGGKIAGAGGGGFLMLVCPTDKIQSVRSAMNGMQELHISLERDGSKVIFNNRRH
jgi:D-glycero-alpha-D-manno-heptose-7-phosphate kinase